MGLIMLIIISVIIFIAIMLWLDFIVNPYHLRLRVNGNSCVGWIGGGWLFGKRWAKTNKRVRC